MGTKTKGRGKLWHSELAWFVFGLAVSIKCLLIKCYQSTDFEVHRNWLSIVHNLPLREWYYSNVSEWTLDYPPFFAYFEKSLSLFASVYDANILTLQKDALYTENTLIFQRYSVIAVDIFYGFTCVILSTQLVTTMGWLKKKIELAQRVELGIFVLLLLNPSLILLDNVHFQYNSFLYGFLYLSIAYILSGKFLKGAFLFAVLLNFKHIYLYYVPAFVSFYAFFYLAPFFDRSVVKRVFTLFLVLFIPLIVSFGPFFLTGGISCVIQILQRLFPFKRGLTHAYWAPNFWALYNFLDFMLYKVLSLNIVRRTIPILLSIDLLPPQYTRGMVIEYHHSVLPNITPSITFILTIISIIPVVLVMFIKKMGLEDKFLVSMILSSYGFFVFGWHVHEKALLMVFLPSILLVIKNLRFHVSFNLLCFSCVFSIFPLIFTPLENLLKYGLGIGYFILHFYLFFFMFKLSPKKICSSAEFIFLALLFFIEFYNDLLHKLLFPKGADFLPLILSSVVCSLGVLFSYVQFLYLVFGRKIQIWLAKRRCLRIESRISKEELTQQQADVRPKISLVGGVDISQCVEYPSLGIASLTVVSYPDLKIVDFFDEVVLLSFDYIPEYLALRESEILYGLVKKFVTKRKTHIDAIFVDGNGKYHSRLCGLAVHVGYLTNTTTFGASKNFTGYPLRSFGFSETEVDFVAEKIKQKCQCMKLGAILDLNITEPELLSVLRLPNCNSQFYISAGFRSNLADAINLSVDCLSNTIVNPIRLADLRSRLLLQEFFGK